MRDEACCNVQAANNLNWSSSTRLIIHFADYPGHGRFMHDLAHSPLDDYPEEDPGGMIMPSAKQVRKSRSACGQWH